MIGFSEHCFSWVLNNFISYKTEVFYCFYTEICFINYSYLFAFVTARFLLLWESDDENHY